MNKFFKRILVLATVAVIALAMGIFASCTYGLNQEEKRRKEGYNCCVTYDANGGTYGSNSLVTYALVKENSLAPAPGYVDNNTQIKVPTRRTYQLINETKPKSNATQEQKNAAAIASKSWFQAKTDENGKVIYEGEGENKTPVLLTGEPWNFAKDKVTGDVTLVAKWTKVYNFVLCLTEEVEQDGQTVTTEKEIRTYKVNPGDTISDKLYEKKDGELFRRPDYVNEGLRQQAKGEKFTILDFYMNAGLTEQMSMDLVHPGTHTEEVIVIDPETNEEVTQTVETNDVKIYVKYIKGAFDLISSKTIKPLTSISNWYLVEDVDLTGQTWDAQQEFKGTIYGNGYALKNLTVRSFAEKIANGKAHSIFGKVSGLVKDLSFENVTLNIDTEFDTAVQGAQHVAFLAYEVMSSGKFENVTVKDCRILRKSDSIYNIFINYDAPCHALYYNAPTTTQSVTIVQTGVDNPTAVKVEIETE